MMTCGRCAAWAQSNDGQECDKNKGFMLKKCPASCGLCTEIQKHLEDTKAKDEL